MSPEEFTDWIEEEIEVCERVCDRMCKRENINVYNMFSAKLEFLYEASRMFAKVKW